MHPKDYVTRIVYSFSSVHESSPLISRKNSTALQINPNLVFICMIFLYPNWLARSRIYSKECW